AMLPLTRTSINDEGTRIKFVVENFQYEYDLKAEQLAKLGKAPPQPAPVLGGRQGFERRRQFEERQQQDQQEDTQQRDTQELREQGDGRRGVLPRSTDYRSFAPDRKLYVFARKHNLFLVENGKENEAVQLTQDGMEDYSFGGANDDRKARPQVTWAPDSKA